MMKIRMTVIVSLICLFLLLPLFNIFFTSFKPAQEQFNTEYHFLPQTVTLQWYEEILRTTPIIRNILNSFAVAIGTMLISIVVVSMGAYSLSRYIFPLKRTMSSMIIIAYMFPTILLVLPLYRIVTQLQLASSYLGLIITHITFTVPYGIFLLRNFVDTIPISIDECATIDGADPLRIFISVIIPLSKPGIAAVMTYSLINSWNEYLYASVIMSQQEMKTLPVKISEFIVETSEIRWGAVMAAACIALIPVSVLFQFLQKDFIDGLTAGAVKG